MAPFRSLIMKNYLTISTNCAKKYYKRRSFKAITLVELIVVVSVIAILFAIVIGGVIGNVRDRADLAGSSSNLRGIGAAVSLYTNENLGSLPGPILRGQGAVYGMGADSLLYHIGEYMSLGPVPESDQRRFIDSFACPGWKRNVSSEARSARTPTVVWWLNMEAKLVDTDQRREPWGWSNHDPDGPNAKRRIPIRHMQIADPARQMAIQSVDALIGPWARIPQKPVFGDVRIRLFFDWSVETVPVEAGTSVFWPLR
jgi:type II secretory pathway pseudopilin PulG